jgi:hypothetical protein
MSYIGNQPQYTSFLTDSFSGNGSTTVFTLRIAPANTSAVIIGISGVLQSPNDYAVVGNILTFSSPPPTGTNNISVRYLSLPASNVVNSAYRSVTDIIATAGQTTFSTGSYTPGFVEVFRNGVRLGISNYTATSGATVVLGNPANANDLITVVSFFVSSVLNAIPGTSGAVTANFLDASQQGGAGAMIIPTGSTGQRPIGPATGMTRFNTTNGSVEVYLNASASWVALQSAGFSNPYNIDYMIIGGGGGGGNSFNHSACGGGGGAGGLCSAFGVPVSSGYTVMTITIGLGGAGAIGTSGSNIPGSNGQNSSIYFNNNHYPPAVAIGGGGGNGYSDDYGIGGGSGGGAGGAGRNVTIPGGSGAPGQGFAGGNHAGTGQSNSSTSCGGGGGAGGPGGNGTANTTGGAGGLGTNLFSTWGAATNTGVQLQAYPAQSAFSRWFAGGGGGGSCLGANSAGGLGGGGIGGLGNSQNGGNAVANTGSGGGGAAAITGASANGGNGGAGIAIIRYAGSAQRGTGGTVTISGGFVYHVFTGSGTYTA